MMLSAPIVGKLYQMRNTAGFVLEVRVMVSSACGKYHMVRVPYRMPFVATTDQFIRPVGR